MSRLYEYLHSWWPVGAERGFYRRLDGTYQSVFDGETVSGEIPWRSMELDPAQVFCSECGHHSWWHADDMCYEGEYVDDDGHRCYPCNCGQRMGR